MPQKLLAACLLAASAAIAQAQSANALPALNDLQLRATWYEIAHLPVKREKLCAANTSQLIARGEKANQLQFVDTCDLKNGNHDNWSFTAAPPKHTANGKLRVRSLLLFHRQYWILAADPAYNWIVIGSPNHKQLWIYAKASTLDDATLASIKSQAAAQGFDAARLVMTPQTNPWLAKPS